MTAHPDWSRRWATRVLTQLAVVAAMGLLVIGCGTSEQTSESSPATTVGRAGDLGDAPLLGVSFEVYRDPG